MSPAIHSIAKAENVKAGFSNDESLLTVDMKQIGMFICGVRV